MATKAVAVSRRPVPRAFTRSFRTRRKPKFTLPLAVVAGFVPFATQVYGGYQATGVKGALNNIGKLTGYDGNNKVRNMQNFRESGAPQIMIGFLVHLVAGKLGVNRMLGRLGVPYLRI